MANDTPRAGADHAFVTEVATKHGVDLLRFLSRRVATAADARDLAQEAYIRLLRLEHKELIVNPQAYLYRVAANLLYEFQLKRRADVVGLRLWQEEREHTSDPVSVERTVESLAIGQQMQTVLAELTPKCRAVLILHRREGLTYEEIGARLGISARMVKKYLARGLHHCRERLRHLE